MRRKACSPKLKNYKYKGHPVPKKMGQLKRYWRRKGVNHEGLPGEDRWNRFKIIFGAPFYVTDWRGVWGVAGS